MFFYLRGNLFLVLAIVMPPFKRVDLAENKIGSLTIVF